MNRPSPPLDRSTLWDAWIQARQQQSGLTPRAFLEQRGEFQDEDLADLELMLAIEAASPPSALVDAMQPEGHASGVRFAGFLLEESLGQGSSGLVYRARRDAPDSADALRARATDAAIALKILNPLLAASPSRRDSILREAQIAGQLDHPNIVRILASGMERGYAWIAAEYAPGETLDAWIERPATPERRLELAIRIGLQLASALQHAHQRGIVHRDLKPTNLILTPEGQLKILDFGLARTQGTAFSVSRTGEIVGTPLYMAPEQARGEAGIGPATDIHAIGLILYELASGTRLSTEGPLHLLISQLARGGNRVRSIRLQGVPRGLRPILRRALEPHPADRYSDCLQLAADLEDLQAGKPLRIGALHPVQRTVRRIRRNPGEAFLGLLAAIALTFASAYLWHNQPVAITFTTVDDGKRIWINDEAPQISTARVLLRPGEHRYEARFADSKYGFAGTFLVKPHTPTRITKILSPWYGVPHTPKLPTDLTPGAYAWVVLANPLPQVQLLIDGTDHGQQPGIAAFLLPLGRHTIEARAAGQHSFRREIELSSEELCFLPFEFDSVDSPWQTLIVYSPFDYQLRELLIEQRDLRMHVEKESLDIGERIFVRKAYWGPDRDFEVGRATLRLPIPPQAVDLAVETVNLSWVSSLGGPQEIHSHMYLGFSPELQVQIEPPLERADLEAGGDHAGWESLALWNVPRVQLEPLRSELAHKSHLYVTAEVGGCEAGEDNAYSFAFRTNALPERLEDGRLVWQPTLRVMFRKAAQ
jgi:hypothetical protein